MHRTTLYTASRADPARSTFSRRLVSSLARTSHPLTPSWLCARRLGAPLWRASPRRRQSAPTGPTVYTHTHTHTLSTSRILRIYTYGSFSLILHVFIASLSLSLSPSLSVTYIHARVGRGARAGSAARQCWRTVRVVVTPPMCRCCCGDAIIVVMKRRGGGGGGR